MNKHIECKVDPDDDSVNLEQIVNAFNSAVREEHAWALCHQCALFYANLVIQKHAVLVPNEICHIYLKTTGEIHEKTAHYGARPPLSEKDILVGLGIVIYATLDPDINRKEEERILPVRLEQLINDMMDGENLEACTENLSPGQTLLSIARQCEDRLEALTRSQAENHYKNVLRALVTEALELATLLEKVAQGTLTTSPEQSKLEQLNYSDWARFWMQVMNELRMGVKLKKVSCSRAPIEYELTPYEMLMKDIRRARYNLRKIMVNGEAPSRVTKDAHAVILEFIRSRPPLKKASDRKLPPPKPRPLTPREQLLNSIRSGRKLRSTIRESRFNSLHPVSICDKLESSSNRSSPLSGRRLIKVDFSQLIDDTFDGNDDDCDNDESASEADSNLPIWPMDSDALALDAYDLAMSHTNSRRSTLDISHSVPHSRPGSRQSCTSSDAEHDNQMEPELVKAIRDDLADGKLSHGEFTPGYLSLDARLSLTLAEIVQIRAVLTKAEVESLPIEARVRHDVEARKVCFLCLKTRFGLFGPWGRRCFLCKRTVCVRCCAKMNVPLEHFGSVPVVLLSPSIMASPTECIGNDSVDFRISPTISKSAFTSDINQSSPTTAGSIRKALAHDGDSGSKKFRTRAKHIGQTARMVERIRPQRDTAMIVCHDCKRMVLQIIESGRANRTAIRNKTLQGLSLNLSPVF